MVKTNLKKINIGAGPTWYEEGWDVLDNAPGNYNQTWKLKGKAWKNSLPDDTYDIVITSHMLEHVPHFRLEKTISEFNRIMKTGATLRILVPCLKKASLAYINNNKSFFATSEHNSDHLGIGGSFVRVLISPGGQTIAMSREMDEFFGGYAHLYSFDFEMLKTLLDKWGFGNITESKVGASKIKELRKTQCLIHDNKSYKYSDKFVKEKKFLKTGKNWHFSGFDKVSDKQLIVEAIKIKDIKYSFDKEYKFNKGARLDDKVMNIKIFLIKIISDLVDLTYYLYKKIKFW